MIEVQYHSDGYAARPAVNVKLHVNGQRMQSPEVNDGMPDEADDLGMIAYDEVCVEFWADATERAAVLGLGEIERAGRSGGWLVLTDAPMVRPILTMPAQYDPTWLSAYRRLSDWCADRVADAPRLVRERTRSLAIDRAGQSAARRMFGHD